MGDTEICVYLVFCVVYSYIHHMFRKTHLHMVWPLAIIYHKYIYSHLYQGKQAVLGSSPPSSHPAWIYSTEPISAPVHPLTSHHFTQLFASTSLFLFIAHNNPPKSLSGSAFPNSHSRKHNGNSARSTGKQRRSVSLINAFTSVGDFLCR